MKIRILLVSVLVFCFFGLNSSVIVFSAAPCSDCCLIASCGGSGSFQADECKQKYDGSWYCADGTATEDCHQCYANWQPDGCKFIYRDRTCTDASCAAAGGESGATYSSFKTYTCCTARSGDCASKTGSYCNNPADCDRGEVTGKDSTSTEWIWYCTGTCGGNSVRCTADRKKEYDNSCGAATNNQYYESVNAPVATDLCGSYNTSSGLTNGLNGMYKWECTGQCQSDGVGCSAPNDTFPKVTPTIALYNDVTGTPSPIPRDVRNGVSINNNCQAAFGSSNKSVWRLTATDANGIDDIKSVQIRLNPVSGGNLVTPNAQVPSDGVANFVIDTKDFTADTYKVEYRLEDMNDPPGWGSWTDSGRSFKVWDCLLDIGGTFFDSSNFPRGGLCSSNLGYSNLISDKKEFGLSYVSNVGLSSEMSVDSPYFNSNNENDRKLKWSETTTYIANFQNFPGIEPNETRVNGQCVGNITIDLGNTKIVDPYNSDPNLQVDYSSIMEQDPWFSVNNGSVMAVGKVNNYVPITCPLNNATNLSMCATSINGIIWTKYTSSLLSNFDRCKIQNRSYFNKPVDIGNYTYNNLKNEYFNKLGVGTTFSGNRKWSDIKSADKITLIQGDLEIDENINDGQFRIIIAGGTITINETVNLVNAALVANSVKANGNSADQLVINGSVYGYSSVDFRRSFADGMDNNTNPSVLVQYDPSLLFKMPKELVKIITQWKME